MVEELSYPSPLAVAAGSSVDLRLSTAPFVGGALAVLGLGSANGGYFPSSWGWALVAIALALAWATMQDVAPPSPLETVFLGGLLLLAGWYAVSALWGVPSTALEEAFRALVYGAGTAAALTIVRRGSRGALAGGVLAGSSAVAAYSLATRLFPEHVGTFDSVAGYRLAMPIGYWNALGLLCAVALLLAVGLAASAGTAGRAALAAAPAPVLAATLYFTFGRGAWLSLGSGLLLALALDPRRLRLTGAAIALGVPAAIGVLVGSRSSPLTHQHTVIAAAARDGHRLAVVIALLVPCAAALAAGLALASRRVAVPLPLSRAYALALALVVLAGLGTGLVRGGGPVAVVDHAWHSFSASSPNSGADLNQRLFSFSGTGRADLYRAAWNDAQAHPLLGSGAGSFEAYWLAYRPNSGKVRDAHSLYLETLAELGLVGLLLLVVALATPLVAAVRARRRPGVAAAGGAYAAYLVGAGVDWDWEITSVTLAALLVGVAILAAARSDEDEERQLSPRLRYGLLAGAVAIGAAAFVFLVGNMLLSRASTAAAHAQWTTAARDARRAASWLPWSTQPWQQLGEAQLAQGQTAAAEASFRTGIRKDRGDWSLWLDLARASSGATQAAALAQASRLDPLSPEVAEFRSELGSSGGISITAGAKP